MSAPSFDPNATFGAILIGGLVSATLFGVTWHTTAQFYVYYTRFPDGTAVIKAVVSFVWLGEAAHVGCVSHLLYTWLVTDYGHPEDLLKRPPRSVLGLLFLTVVIAVSVQIFFSYRIYVFSGSAIIPYFTYTLSFVRLAIGMVLFGIGLGVPSLEEFITKWNKLAVTSWSLSAAEDIIITATLASLLWIHKGQIRQ
ncbi:hypothetical protein C8F01DRAFT_1262487 [Mycena amicta]|nr:hypothetical protein C8F01DRAFT_1262487 [Mycena amicta]